MCIIRSGLSSSLLCRTECLYVFVATLPSSESLLLIISLYIDSLFVIFLMFYLSFLASLIFWPMILPALLFLDFLALLKLRLFSLLRGSWSALAFYLISFWEASFAFLDLGKWIISSKLGSEMRLCLLFWVEVCLGMLAVDCLAVLFWFKEKELDLGKAEGESIADRLLLLGIFWRLLIFCYYKATFLMPV